MRLFHFSDDPAIATFVPRPVRVAPVRAPAQEWLNGPLVWAIDDWHQAMYLFPRDCPRIVLWPSATTTDADRARWWGKFAGRMIAYVEDAWLPRIAAAQLTRYEFAPALFEDLHDAGMWVSREPATPVARTRIADLPAELVAQGCELHAVESLAPLKDAWKSSLHVSGIRLRHAAGWSGG